MIKEEQPRHPELVATLPGSTSKEYLRACKEVGMNWLRIHGDKTDPVKAADLISNAHAVGLKVSYDTNGKKPRVRYSLGMDEVKEGLEKGQFLKLIRPEETGKDDTRVPGETIIFTPLNYDRQTALAEVGLPESIFVCQLSTLPQVFQGSGNELLSFADGKITFYVRILIKSGDNTTAIIAEVKSVHDTEGLFWRMGANSTTNDLFSGDDPTLVQEDILKLTEVLNRISDDGPDQIAISFVSTKEQILESQKLLTNLGINIPTLAKIETTRGVDNINEIVSQTDVEVARGDLTEALNLTHKYSLEEAEKKIVEAANLAGRKVIIATHVADSLLEKVKSGISIQKERLTHPERVAVCLEYPVADGFMLAAETMTSGKNAIDVVRSANLAIKVAERYWQIWQT